MTVNWPKIRAVLEAERETITTGVLLDVKGHHCSLGALADAIGALDVRGHGQGGAWAGCDTYDHEDYDELYDHEKVAIEKAYGIPTAWMGELYEANDSRDGDGESVDAFLATLAILEAS